VLLRYATRVNGLTELVLTKLDILTGLEQIQLCSAYRDKDQTYPDLPLGLNQIGKFEPVYESLPGWQADIGQTKHWSELPSEARDYVQRIADLTGLPISSVSVGPERDQIIEIR